LLEGRVILLAAKVVLLACGVVLFAGKAILLAGKIVLLAGKLKHEVTHSKFREFSVRDSISGMCIQEGILWVAARGAGLLKFDIIT